MKPTEAQINLDNPINILWFRFTIDGRDRIHGMQIDHSSFSLTSTNTEEKG